MRTARAIDLLSRNLHRTFATRGPRHAADAGRARRFPHSPKSKAESGRGGPRGVGTLSDSREKILGVNVGETRKPGEKCHTDLKG